METETPTHNDDDEGRKWSCATNWTTAYGSIDTSVTLESTESPIDSEALGSTRKSPLILRPPSPDSGPCEIKICFMQKHEVRQVYVRSTARVYEIYYVPSLQSSNAYLCTVRCSIAASDEVLHATDSAEAACAPLKGSTGELAEEKSAGEGNIATNEDDWIEVKVTDSPLLVSRISSSEKGDAITGRSIQDFYEATAEINDADPCISLTLRLLSLQNKACICVDEVYIFADPVEPADSENQAVQVGNSAGGSIMAAMLVPTLLQLSKSGSSQIQDIRTAEKPEYLEIGSKATDSTDIVNEIQLEKKFSIADKHDVKLQKVKEATAEPPQFLIPTQVSYMEKKSDSVVKKDTPYGQVESVLEQLVSRVTRIEDLCIRFEENLLKPINSMEARLHRVEKQLEVLTKNSQCSELPPGTRIYAPSFSCNESNSGSFYNDGSDHSSSEPSELGRKDFHSNKLSNPINDMSTLVSAPQLLPSLVVTAPEFSCGDDEEDDDFLEPPKDSPRGKPKQALSIDDALAAAIAGFLSTTTVQPSEYAQSLTVIAHETTSEETGNEPSRYTQILNVTSEFSSEKNGNGEPALDIQTRTVTGPQFASEENGNSELSKYTQTLKVTASEFIVEENGIDEEVASPSTQNGQPVVPSGSRGTDGNKSICGSLSTYSDTASAECAAQETRILYDAHFEKTSEGVDEGYQFYEEGTGCSLVGNSTDYPTAQDTSKTDDFHTTKETRRTGDGGVSNVSVSKQEDFLEQFVGIHAEERSDATLEEGSVKDIFLTVSEYSCSTLDFDIPILDVKFASSDNSGSKSPLEALLTDVREFKTEAPCVQESDDGVQIGKESNLIIMEDGESICSQTNNYLLVNLDCCDIRDMSSNVEDELHDSHPRNNHEMVASLI